VTEINGAESADDFETADAEAEHEAEPTSDGARHGTGETGERRRRRRRRGRRGRRFESHLPSSEALAQPDAPAVEAGSGASSETPIALAESAAPVDETSRSPTRDTTAPNTPSSPVWSLVDRAEETRTPAPPPLTALASAEEEEPVIQGVAPQPGVETTETVVEEPAVADSTPRETRRGWWQRRFKA
jgi:ribonuclease E